MRQTVFAILALAAAGAGPLHAQQHVGARHAVHPPSRVVINAHAFAMPGFSISGADLDTPIDISMGPGVGAQVGYAFSPRYMLYAGGDLGRLGAAPEDDASHWSLTMLEVGGRMSFPKPASRLTPYITAAVGTRAVSAQILDFGDVKIHGMTVSGGGGITYLIGPNIALNGAAVVSIGKLGHYEGPDGKFHDTVDNSTSTRLQLGLDWRP